MSTSPDEYLKLGGTNWDQLQKLISGKTVDPDELKQRQAEAEERRLYFEGMTYRTFSTGEGRLWLVEYLKPVTIEQPCYVLGQDSGFADRMGWIREGQNTIYRYIRDCIRMTEGRMKPGKRPKPIPL